MMGGRRQGRGAVGLPVGSARHRSPVSGPSDQARTDPAVTARPDSIVWTKAGPYRSAGVNSAPAVGSCNDRGLVGTRGGVVIKLSGYNTSNSTEDTNLNARRVTRQAREKD